MNETDFVLDSFFDKQNTYSSEFFIVWSTAEISLLILYEAMSSYFFQYPLYCQISYFWKDFSIWETRNSYRVRWVNMDDATLA